MFTLLKLIFNVGIPEPELNRPLVWRKNPSVVIELMEISKDKKCIKYRFLSLESDDTPSNNLYEVGIWKFFIMDSYKYK